MGRAKGSELGDAQVDATAHDTQAPEGETALEALQRRIRSSGIRSVRMVAWRDVDDPEAGGSEIHADAIAQRWASAGLKVTLRTSAIEGARAQVERNGYHIDRRSGRYALFSNAAREGFRFRAKADEGLVEIWNGMPFFSPIWFRGPRVTFIHHVHDVMWDLTLPPWMAKSGRILETTVAPRIYARESVVTLSQSSRNEIVDMMGLTPEKVRVVPPGVDEIFRPSVPRSATPLVVAVGRLVPVKGFDALIASLVAAHEVVPQLEAVIVGEGREREALVSLVRELRATSWLHLAGRVEGEELVRLYGRAWLVASASMREGWGMTLSEAGACGTPAVATDIAGHRDVVRHGVSGLLVNSATELSAAIAALLTDEQRRSAMGEAALRRASELSWDRTAAATFSALAHSSYLWRRRPTKRSTPTKLTTKETTTPAKA